MSQTADCPGWKQSINFDFNRKGLYRRGVHGNRLLKTIKVDDPECNKYTKAQL